MVYATRHPACPGTTFRKSHYTLQEGLKDCFDIFLDFSRVQIVGRRRSAVSYTTCGVVNMSRTKKQRQCKRAQIKRAFNLPSAACLMQKDAKAKAEPFRALFRWIF